MLASGLLAIVLAMSTAPASQSPTSAALTSFRNDAVRRGGSFGRVLCAHPSSSLTLLPARSKPQSRLRQHCRACERTPHSNGAARSGSWFLLHCRRTLPSCRRFCSMKLGTSISRSWAFHQTTRSPGTLVTPFPDTCFASNGPPFKRRSKRLVPDGVTTLLTH